MSTEAKVDSDESATLFKKALRAVVGKGLVCKRPTHSSMSLVQKVIDSGNPDGLVLRALQRLSLDRAGDKLLLDAEAKGATHPILYYFLGQGFATGLGGLEPCYERSMDYFQKAIRGELSLCSIGS